MFSLTRRFIRSIFVVAIALFISTTASVLAQSTNPIPFVNLPLVPSSVAPGAAELALTVNGTGFVPTSVVKWNGASLGTAFVSSHQLVADVPSSFLSTGNTASVTVSSPGAVASFPALFTVTKSKNSLTFSTSVINVGVGPSSVVTGDFNNDGKTDLAVLNELQPNPCYTFEGKGTIQVLLGDGNGGFTTASNTCFPNSDGTATLPYLTTGDFNGDGKLDLAGEWYANGGSYIEFYAGNGDGRLADSGTVGLTDVGFALVPAFADFNRDGILDFAFPSNDSVDPGVLVYFGNGNADFTYGGGVTSGFPVGSAATPGDFNGDGILDLALIGFDAAGDPPGPILMLRGTGQGYFVEDTTEPSTTLVNPSSMVTGDFNGDGILDLAFADSGSTGLTVLLGNGDGTFTQKSGQPDAGQTTSFIATADLNGDGKLDLVLVGENVLIFLGNGDGTFRLGSVLGNGVSQVAIGDFNGDGRLDLALTNSASNTVSILLQQPPSAAVTVTLASTQNPAFIDQPVTYWVFASASSTTPTGSVTFKKGTEILGTAPLIDGNASFTTSFNTVGNFSIFASYSGDQNYPPKSSRAVKQSVTLYPSQAWGTFADPDPSIYGQDVTLICYVSSPDASPAPPSGTVEFLNGVTSLGKTSLVNGTATLVMKRILPMGWHYITCSYKGDALYSGSSEQTLIQVLQATSTTTVSSSSNPSAMGDSVTFTAVVTSPTAKPFGTVTFKIGATTLGTVSLQGGKARLSTSALPAGTSTVTAVYEENADFYGSSGSIVQTVK